MKLFRSLKPVWRRLGVARHFLSSDDITAAEQDELIDRAFALKAEREAPVSARRNHKPLEGKSIGLIFEKPSTRTRVSFEVAIHDLGGHPVVLRGDELQLGRGETLQDTGRVLSRYLDAVVVRTYGQGRLESLAETATVPVINALSDAEHPCQALADIMTIKERFDDPGSVRLAYVGDGNNVCHSLLIAGAKAGLASIAVACPDGYEPIEPVVDRARTVGEETGTKITQTQDPSEAVKGANVVYTDVWASMGQEDEQGQRSEIFAPYRVSAELLEGAERGAMILHCLPAHRGQEITADVLDSSLADSVWDQAENRLHAQKALLEWICGDL
jgi:ornithine carbamoyltransferase